MSFHDSRLSVSDAPVKKGKGASTSEWGQYGIISEAEYVI